MLEERYSRLRRGNSRGGGPVVYPVVNRPAGAQPLAGGFGMSFDQVVVAGLIFVMIAWAGAGAVAWGVVELSGGGEQGEQGVAGPQGEQGEAGDIGPQGPAGNDAAMEMIKRLGAMFAVQQKSALNGGAFVAFNDTDIGACVKYIITGEPGVSACPGFSGGQ